MFRPKVILFFTWMIAACTGMCQGVDFVPDTLPLRAPVSRSYGHFVGSGGLAFPVGPFSFRDLNESSPGFANTGYSVNFLDATHRFHRYLGWGVRWSRHQFGYDHQALADWFNVRIPTIDFRVLTEDPWVMHLALFHAVGTFPTEIVDFDMRLGLGFAYARRPAVLMEGYDRNTGFFSYSWRQDQSESNTLGYGFGFNVRWHVDQDIDVVATWDYQALRPDFTVVNTYARSFIVDESLEQPISLISLGLGVAIRL